MPAADQVRADRRLGRLLVGLVVVCVWGLITHGTFAGSGDEPHYLVIAHSIAFDGDLDVSNDYAEATLIGGGTLKPEAHAIEHDGRLRPVHDIGMPLVLAPVVRIAYVVAERLGDALPQRVLDAARLNKSLLLRHQISLVIAFLTGLLARELFLLLRQLGGTSRTAFLWALLFAVTPPVLSHSFLFFTEIPTALIAVFVFRRVSTERITTAGLAALAGALTGFLWLVHARNIGLVIGLTAVTIAGMRRRVLSPRVPTAFLLAVAAAAAARTLTTYALWGSFLTTPHAAVNAAVPLQVIGREVFVRFTGLLFDREYGLFAYGPIYLLAASGLFLLWQRRRQLSLDSLIVVACYLIPVLLPLTNVHGWQGGWSPAARFLVPIAPLLWIGVYGYATGAARFGRIVVIALLVIQLSLDAFVWQFPKTLWNDGDGVTALRWVSWLPSWTSSGAAVVFALFLLAAAIFTLTALRLELRQIARPQAPRA